jgi:hypothetical protein
MPLFKYFVVVGAVLTLGLFALSSYLEPRPSRTAGQASASSLTSSVMYFGQSPAKPAKMPRH